MTPSIADAEWLAEPHLQTVLGALARDGEEARVVGGAVRNALLGLPAKDIDIATTRLPDNVIAVTEAEGYRPVPTGIEHGTVTIVTPAGPYEVTTLRTDLETDGRHAVVAFGRDWQSDAERRDLTVNALYAESDGRVVDLVGGVADLEKRLIRFIGDPDRRIEEDALRILRFFRFHAQYGAGRPDAEGLKACARHKGMLSALSAERVWSELRRLLGTPDPHRTVLWMRQTSVLTSILPESERWGIDGLGPLIAVEERLDLEPDPLLRLMAIIPLSTERVAALSERLRLSNEERDRLLEWAGAEFGEKTWTDTPAETERTLYRKGSRPYIDHALLALARSVASADDDLGQRLHERIALALNWKPLTFPIKGRDLIENGAAPGPDLGRMLGRLEDEWIASGFKLDRDELLARM